MDEEDPLDYDALKQEEKRIRKALVEEQEKIIGHYIDLIKFTKTEQYRRMTLDDKELLEKLEVELSGANLLLAFRIGCMDGSCG